MESNKYDLRCYDQPHLKKKNLPFLFEDLNECGSLLNTAEANVLFSSVICSSVEIISIYDGNVNEQKSESGVSSVIFLRMTHNRLKNDEKGSFLIIIHVAKHLYFKLIRPYVCIYVLANKQITIKS
jgi:hypothetical protein